MMGRNRMWPHKQIVFNISLHIEGTITTLRPQLTSRRTAMSQLRLLKSSSCKARSSQDGEAEKQMPRVAYMAMRN